MTTTAQFVVYRLHERRFSATSRCQMCTDRSTQGTAALRGDYNTKRLHEVADEADIVSNVANRLRVKFEARDGACPWPPSVPHKRLEGHN